MGLERLDIEDVDVLDARHRGLAKILQAAVVHQPPQRVAKSGTHQDDLVQQFVHRVPDGGIDIVAFIHLDGFEHGCLQGFEDVTDKCI